MSVCAVGQCTGCRKIKHFHNYDFSEYPPLCDECRKKDMCNRQELIGQPRPTDQELSEMSVDDLIEWISLHEIKPLLKNENNSSKETIPADLRWAVWERDNFTCKNCGSRRYLTVDHIFPESLGGETILENFQTLCKSCNSKKGTKSL